LLDFLEYVFATSLFLDTASLSSFSLSLDDFSSVDVPLSRASKSSFTYKILFVCFKTLRIAFYELQLMVQYDWSKQWLSRYI